MSPLQLRTALAHCLGTELERCAAAARPSARGAASRGTDYAGGGREEG